MIASLARLVVGHRRLVLALSAAVLAGFVALALGAFSVLRTGGFDDPGSSSTRATALLDRDFGGAANLVLLVTPIAAGSTVDSPAVARAGVALTGRLRGRSDVSGVASYWSGRDPALRSRDGRGALITMHVLGSEDSVLATSDSVVSAVAGARGAVLVRAGGPLGFDRDSTAQVGRDLALAESIAVPVTLVLLLLAFGSVVAAALPLAIGLVAVAGTFAELDVLGHLTEVSVYAVNLTTALGLGLGIDYALLIVNRFREELGAGEGVEGAVARTLATAGRTVVFSAATVALALAAMAVFPLYFLRSFAYSGIGVVLIAMLSALLTLPALLATLGHRVDAGRFRRGHRPLRSASAESPFWRRVAAAVLARPVVAALPVVAVLLALASPVLHIRFATPDDRVLPSSAPSRQVGDELRSSFDSTSAAALYPVLVGRPAAPAVAAYAARLSALPGVTGVVGAQGAWVGGRHIAPAVGNGSVGNGSVAAFSRPGIQYFVVTGPTDSSSVAAQALVHAVRSAPVPAASRVLVGGSPAALVDSKAAIGSHLAAAVLWICLTTAVLLFLFTGSVVLPMKALVLNALSLSAVFGVIVWVFQDGHLSGLLGFTPGPVNTSMPVLLFCIAFGLSMDYEVFLLARIKELHDGGASTREAVAGGLARTGRIVTTAAALLSVTFIAFGTARVSFLQLFGVGTAVAVILDVTLVRGVLVPALMRLAGRANWWAPPPLRRVHARFAVQERPSRPAPAQVRGGHRTQTPGPRSAHRRES